MEGDHRGNKKLYRRFYFNPLPPHGGRPHEVVTLMRRTVISIHSLRMEGDIYIPASVYDIDISIHSLRMEGDKKVVSGDPVNVDFNPLPPHGGRLISLFRTASIPYFNPLPPHGGRLQFRRLFLVVLVISIHSLRMEGDIVTARKSQRALHFNPLPPHGGRPCRRTHCRY